MDAVERAHWAEELGAWCWLIVLLELDLLFWVGVFYLVKAVL